MIMKLILDSTLETFPGTLIVYIFDKVIELFLNIFQIKIYF